MPCEDNSLNENSNYHIINRILKRHIFAWNDVIWRIERQNQCNCLGSSKLEEPTNEKKKPSKDTFTYTH